VNDAWHCVEAMFKLNSVTLWIDELAVGAQSLGVSKD
jgi:hypothetical protein